MDRIESLDNQIEIVRQGAEVVRKNVETLLEFGVIRPKLDQHLRDAYEEIAALIEERKREEGLL